MDDDVISLRHNPEVEEQYFRNIRLCIAAEGIPMSRGSRKTLRRAINPRHKLKPNQERILQHELSRQPYEAIKLMYDGFKVEDRIENGDGNVKYEMHFDNVNTITITDPDWVKRFTLNQQTFTKWLNDNTHKELLHVLNKLNDRYHQLIMEGKASPNINLLVRRYNKLLGWRKHFRRWYSSKSYPIPIYAWDILGANPKLLEIDKSTIIYERTESPKSAGDIKHSATRRSASNDTMVSDYINTLKKLHIAEPSINELANNTGFSAKLWSTRLRDPIFLAALLKEIKSMQGYRHAKKDDTKKFWEYAKKTVEDLIGCVSRRNDIYTRRQHRSYDEGIRTSTQNDIRDGYEDEQ